MTIFACMVALVLFQLMPLPPAWWGVLPGRTPFAQTYVNAGLPVPWHVLTLDPNATARSGLSLLPGIALFLAGKSLDVASRRILVLVFIGLCGASLLLGVAQVSVGPDGFLRPYTVTNESSAVGFFANANHFAMLLVCAIPITAAAGAIAVAEWSRGARGKILIIAMIFIVLLVGIATSKSRAGLVLGLLATIASLGMIIVTVGPRKTSRRLPMVSAAVVVTIGTAVLFYGLASRISLNDEIRRGIAAATWHARAAFDPLGSGLGTFSRVYPIFEGELVAGTFVNHAHNDWFELWLEGGWPAVALITAFLVWFCWRVRVAWRACIDVSSDIVLARAASLVVVVLMLHSFVDYPLRTEAHIAILSLACLLLTAPPADPPRVDLTQAGSIAEARGFA